jgi:hypothetical protein
MVELGMRWVGRLGLIMLNMMSKDFGSRLYTRPKSFEILIVNLIVVVNVRSSLLLDNTLTICITTLSVQDV